MKKKRGIIISGALAQDHEFIYPYYRLLENKVSVDVCILENTFVKGFLGTTLPPNKDQKLINIKKAKVENYDILVLPGGVKAMEKVRQNKDIINFIYRFNKKKKIIACICSGAQLLISAKIVLGRKIAGYYSMKDDIINAGAKYTDRPAVVDQNLITTAHYKDMGPWMAETIRLLNK